jgi:hypothetical protein
MLAAINHLKDDEDLGMCIAAHVKKNAMAEATTLLPHLERLNAGKQYLDVAKEESFGHLKKRKRGEASGPGNLQAPTPEELEESAVVLYKWLLKGTESDLRMLIVVLSSGGVFYGAHAADKVARAWLQHAEPPVDQATVVRVVKARHEKKPDAPVQSASVKERPRGSLYKK